MNFNSFKISWRILTKYKANTIINLTGMIVAFTAAILILVYIINELNFDKFQEKSSRIYRLNSAITMADGKEMHATVSNGKLPEILLQKMPEIESISRFYYWGTNDVIHGDKRFTTDHLYWVDTSFFNIFSFDLVSGSKAQCLQEPNSIIISETCAVKMFGNINPLQKSLKIGRNTYMVTAIIKDAPATSHIQFDMLASISSIENAEFDIAERNGFDFTFYLLLKEGVDYQAFLPKFSQICDNHVSEKFGSYGINIKHSLQPMSKVHLHSNFEFDRAVTGDMNNIKVFSILAIFILLIASMNYINLMTAQSEVRLRESGMRKVLGADKSHLIQLFLIESIIICLSALIIAFGLADLLLTAFGNLLDIKLNSTGIFDPLVIAIMLIITLATSFISGVYPAIIVSTANPAKILKGSKGNKVNGSFSKYLVALQFGITVFLIITVILINQQVKYMKNKDLGFNKDNLISVTNVTNKLTTSYPSIRAQLLENPNFESVTASQDIPGVSNSVQNCYRYGEDPKSGFIINEIRMQDYYLKTFGFRLMDGRDFNPNSKSDSSSFLINETAAKKLGFKDPVGKKIQIWNQSGTIIGVVSDFHFTSMHKAVEPLVFTRYQEWFNNITVKIKGNRIKESLTYLEKVIKSADPNYNFNYMFVDQTFESMYRKEERLNDMVTTGSAIAIIISVMGLFSLTAFSVRRRVKEIGIRKTLGASVPQILMLISGKILTWMIPGMLLAFPFAWWAAESWLNGFAYRIALINYWWVWIVGGIIALLVGFLTIYYQSVKTANTNPVDCLMYE